MVLKLPMYPPGGVQSTRPDESFIGCDALGHDLLERFFPVVAGEEARDQQALRFEPVRDAGGEVGVLIRIRKAREKTVTDDEIKGMIF